MIHQIFANGVMPSSLERDLHLGAHAVGRAHQNGAFPSRKEVSTPKTADISKDGAVERAARVFPNQRYRAVRLRDAYTCVFVSNRSGRRASGSHWYAVISYGTLSATGARTSGLY